jgi:hypothetical protein
VHEYTYNYMYNFICLFLCIKVYLYVIHESVPVIRVVKGKAVPLQAWSGPEGSRNLRFPDYMTTAQDGGKVVILTRRPPLPPGNAPGTHSVID